MWNVTTLVVMVTALLVVVMALLVVVVVALLAGCGTLPYISNVLRLSVQERTHMLLPWIALIALIAGAVLVIAWRTLVALTAAVLVAINICHAR